MLEQTPGEADANNSTAKAFALRFTCGVGIRGFVLWRQSAMFPKKDVSALEMR